MDFKETKQIKTNGNALKLYTQLMRATNIVTEKMHRYLFCSGTF